MSVRVFNQRDRWVDRTVILVRLPLVGGIRIGLPVTIKRERRR